MIYARNYLKQRRSASEKPEQLAFYVVPFLATTSALLYLFPGRVVIGPHRWYIVPERILP